MTASVLASLLLAVVPVFRGYEPARYQSHDALIARLTREFNRHRGAWADANRAQAKQIPDITEELIKAHMIQETGGGTVRSQQAWRKDPLQVNVPGDWIVWKGELGLRKPAVRNEGTLEGNLRAGLKFLVRKGFSASGRPVRTLGEQTFVDWGTALERYSGRTTPTASGKQYCVEYADRIIERAEHHGRHVPIDIKLKE